MFRYSRRWCFWFESAQSCHSHVFEMKYSPHTLLQQTIIITFFCFAVSVFVLDSSRINWFSGFLFNFPCLIVNDNLNNICACKLWRMTLKTLIQNSRRWQNLQTANCKDIKTRTEWIHPRIKKRKNFLKF